jgi:DNA-binding XRE family transcriptional regulator
MGIEMPRTAAKVTQADIARVLRAAAQTPGRWRVEIEDGKITVAEAVEAKGTARYNPDIKL